MNQSWDYNVIEGVSIADLDEESFNIFREEAVNAEMLKDSPARILEELELIKNPNSTPIVASRVSVGLKGPAVAG